MAIANYTIDLIVFYGVCFIICFALIRTRSVWERFVSALIIVIVGSEYYEIPLFIKGYLHGPTPHVLHHVIVVLLFTILISVQKVKWNKANLSLLLLGPLLTAPILYWFPQAIYVARTIGLTFLLVTVATSSEGVGGKAISRKP